MTIIWCIVPKIWSATDRIFCPSGPFFALFPPMDPENQNFEKMKKNPKDIIILHMHHKWQSCDVWFLAYGVKWTEFFVILDRFLPFYAPNNPKNQHYEKLKKKQTPGDIINLHMSTINDNHMMYGSWDIKHDGQNFFVILNHFLSF